MLTAEINEEAVKQLPPVSWDQILEVSRAIRASIPDPHVDVFDAVPHGMFVLDYEEEGVQVQHVIHVDEHQRSGWDAMFLFLGRSRMELETITIDALEDGFFSDCEAPVPSSLDLATIVKRVQKGDSLPGFVALEGRAFCDPRDLAKRARENDLRGSEINALLAEHHTALARVIYPSPLDFRRAFDDAIRELEFPDAAPPPKGVAVFEPYPSNPFRPGPHHDLRKLLDQVLVAGSELLGQSLRHEAPVEWSKRVIKGWFGVAHHHGRWSGAIRINRLLDSLDFSAETLRFLLWHEFLHVHLDQGHTEEFRRLERRWPNHAACNRQMDALHEKFGVPYW